MLQTDQQTALRQAATSYAEAGFTIIKLNGKIPATENWPAAEYVWPDELGTWFNGHAGNFGVVLGARDLVIDIDPRNFKPKDDKPHVRLFKDAGLGNIKDLAPIVKTGSGGLHIYFRLPENFKVKENIKAYPGVEFKSVGRQVVGAASIHPDTKRPYAFVSDVPLHKVPLAPEGLLAIIKARAKSKDSTTEKMRDYSDDDATVAQYVDYLKTTPVAIEGDHGDATTFQTACKGRDFGLSPEKTTELMLEHYNGRCVPPWEPQTLHAKVLNAYAYATGQTGNARPETQFEPIPQAEAPHGIVIAYQRDQHGRLLKTVANAYMLLVDPKEPLAGALCYDEFNNRVRIVKELPWVPKSDLVATSKEWSDDDSIHLRVWLSKVKRFEAPLQNIDQSVLAVAQLKKIHPIRDYLNGLKWDGVERLSRWLVATTGAEDNAYIHSASRKILIQAVKRAFEPGCQADYVVILEGEQGIGKTSLVKILGGPWYADLVVDPHARDTVDAMIGKWFIEFSEMEVTRRADAQALKGFITRCEDRVRLAYGHRAKDYRRQCVFIGSINPDASSEYLTDNTGNRRFWPIVLKYVDQPKLIAMRDQLFAEAMQAYKNKENPFITDEKVNALATEEQKKRQVSDPWLVSIAEWIQDKKHMLHTAKNVYIFAIHGNEAQMGVYENKRVIHCLKELGFHSVVEKDKEIGKSVRGYRYRDATTETISD